MLNFRGFSLLWVGRFCVCVGGRVRGGMAREKWQGRLGRGEYGVGGMARKM